MASTNPTKILLTGATGYIGGSLLVALLERGDQYQISALIRSASQAPTLEKLGVTPVLGSLSDLAVIEKASSDADIVIHTADVDPVDPIKAFVAGLKKRAIAKGSPTYLIQTSGTGTLLDKAGGDSATDKIYNDLNSEELYNLPLEASHQEVNRFVLDLPQEHVHSVLLYPSNIYGLGKGPFNQHSFITTHLIRASIKQGKVQVVGKGLNYWGNVHIDDVVSAYLLLIDRLLDGTASIGREGIYFASSSEETMANTAKVIAEALHKRGVVEDTTVTPFPADQLETVLPFGKYNSFVWGGNTRSEGSRLKKLGWTPAKVNFLLAIDEEVATLLQESQKQ